MLLPKLLKGGYRAVMPSSPSKEDVGDAKHTATNILALLQRTDELKEEDLSAVLEKIKPAGVQKAFSSIGVQSVIVLLHKNSKNPNPKIPKNLLDILGAITEFDDDAREKVTATPGIDKLLLDVLENYKRRVDLHKSWSSLVRNCSSYAPFATIVLESELNCLVLGGLKSEVEPIIYNSVLTCQNICRVLPETEALENLNVVDELARILKSGSPPVKSVVVDLLLYESEIDSHRMVLVSCIGALTDILEGDNTLKGKVLDIISNSISLDCVKIIFMEEKGLEVTEKLYKYGVGDVKDKAKRLLIDLGVIEDSGIVHGVLKGVGKVLDVAVYGVKKVVLVPTVFTAKAMIDVLKFGSDDSKEKAVSVLMKMSQNDTDNVFANKEVILPLVECQKTGSDKLKGLAAFSLGKVTMNNPAAVEHIVDDLHYAVDLLHSPDNKVQNNALQALWMFSFQPECKEKLKTPEVIELIRSFDSEKDPELKDSAHKLLFQLGEWRPPTRAKATRTLNTRTKTAAVPIPKNKNLTIDIPSQTPVKASSSVAPSAAFGNHFSTPTASSTPLSHPWEPPKLSEQVAEEERQGLTDVQQTTANEIVGEIVQTIEETIAADGETDAYESDSDVDSIASQSGESKGNHVMISYNWGVQPMVVEIKKRLDALGFNVWLDVEQMAGSTLEAMAQAVEQSTVVLICYSKKYKESAACRTEAEYAFTLKKPFIPLKMEKDYIPDGWLGAMLGSKLYHEFHGTEETEIATAFNLLVRELGDRGKKDSSSLSKAIAIVTEAQQVVKTASKTEVVLAWTTENVTTWLKEIGLETYQGIFQAEMIDGLALIEMKQIMEKTGVLDFQQFVLSPLSLLSLGHRLRFMYKLRELLK